MTDTPDRLLLAAELTAAWLGNSNTRAIADDVPAFLRSTFQALEGISEAEPAPTQEAEPQEYTPAVSVRKSLANPDFIISMIDGKPYKTLRRHLATNGLSPDEYRERYGLKRDYPMVAANYSESRRAMAKQIGLGRKPAQASGDEATPASDGAAATDATPAPDAAKPKRRSRKSADEA